MNLNSSLKIRVPQIKKISGDECLVAFLFISYFCSEALRSTIARLFGSGVFDVVYNIFFFISVFFLMLSYKRNRLVVPAICYTIIALLFILTIFIHPEYESWYFEKTYGIQVQFFRAVGGIWAFLVVYLVPEKEKLYKYLKICCWILFVFLSLQFYSAQVRGYWVSYGADYSRIESVYNLGWGYSLLFPVVYFATEAYLNRKKFYYIPFSIGAILILLGGSRGAMIWVAVIFLFMLPYRWKSMNKSERVRSLLLILFIAPPIILIYLNYNLLAEGLFYYLSSRGISSRTITALFTGELSEANGRDNIYQMTIERIHEGGLFGNGVFGERIIVGQKYRWGFAHNIFLEIYAAFGYLGGSILSIGLIICTLKTAVRCSETKEQIVFLTFLGAAMKLLLSDSFWFNISFWGLLAIIVMWWKPQKYFRSSQRDLIFDR